MTQLQLSEIIKHRRWFHRHPETAFKEYQTSEHIQEYLRELNVTKVTTIATTGVICEIGEGGTVHAARFNMDALPIHEKNEIDFCSEYPGYSHSCGHDFDLAWGLMIAKHFQQNKPKGTVKLIFQPAEEGPGRKRHGKTGGQILAELGAFDNLSTMTSFHVDPDLDLGQVGIMAGEVTCGAFDFEFILKGVGSQAAKPEQGNNPIPFAANAISDIYRLQEELKKGIKSEEGYILISVSKIKSELKLGATDKEESINTTPEGVTIKGICRLRSEDVRKNLLKGLKEIQARYKSKLLDCVLNVKQVALATVNDARCVSNVIETANQEEIVVIPKRAYWRDDAGWASQNVPTAYGFVGIFDGNKTNLHTPTFNPNEGGLEIGLKLFIGTMERNIAKFI